MKLPASTALLGLALTSVTLAIDHRSSPYLQQLHQRGDLHKRENITQSNCTYPDVNAVAEVWSYLTGGEYGTFFSNFVGDVDWTIMHTQPLSGHYSNLTQFLTNGLFRLFDVAAGPANFSLVNIAGGCENPWSIQETLVEAVAKNGESLFFHALL